jgi:hypothetical protein
MGLAVNEWFNIKTILVYILSFGTFGTDFDNIFRNNPRVLQRRSDSRGEGMQQGF